MSKELESKLSEYKNGKWNVLKDVLNMGFAEDLVLIKIKEDEVKIARVHERTDGNYDFVPEGMVLQGNYTDMSFREFQDKVIRKTTKDDYTENVTFEVMKDIIEIDNKSLFVA